MGARGNDHHGRHGHHGHHGHHHGPGICSAFTTLTIVIADASASFSGVVVHDVVRMLVVVAEAAH